MKEFSNTVKESIIYIIEASILFFSHLVLFAIMDPVRDKFIYDDGYFYNHYKNISTLSILLLTYLIIGLVLFAIFKFVEVRLIKRHRAKSYQYMLAPCVLVSICLIFITGLDASYYVEVFGVFAPIFTIIIASNQIYEFIIRKGKKAPKRIR